MMPVTFAQWCWWTFFVFGSFGGWAFIVVLILKMRSGEAYEKPEPERDVEQLQAVNRTLSTTVQKLMQDLKHADATIAAMQADMEHAVEIEERKLISG